MTRFDRFATVRWFVVAALYAAAFSMLLPLSEAYAQQDLPWRASYTPSFTKLRDTLYVADSTFLEVRLDKQQIIQHFRDGREAVYACSTGDPRIPEAIATREGVFSIQWKSKVTLSSEFNCNLYYWMPFDGGIGFHALDGTSYYRHLGVRPSSHGCVRIANATGAKIFRDSPTGTVVWVHSGTPARLVRFAPDHLVVLTGAPTEGELKNRLAAVLAGNWNDSLFRQPLVLPAHKRFTMKVSVGKINPTLVVQHPLPLYRTQNTIGFKKTPLLASKEIPLLKTAEQLAEEANTKSAGMRE